MSATLAAEAPRPFIVTGSFTLVVDIPKPVQGPRDRRRPELDLRERAQRRRDRVPRHQRRGEPRAGAGAELRHRGVVAVRYSVPRRAARPRRLASSSRSTATSTSSSASTSKPDASGVPWAATAASWGRRPIRADPAAEGQVDAGRPRVPRAQRVHQVLGRAVEGLRHLHGDDDARGSRRRLRRGPRGDSYFGYWQLADGTDRYNKLRLLSRTPLSYATSGSGPRRSRRFRGAPTSTSPARRRDRGDLRRLGGGAASRQIPRPRRAWYHDGVFFTVNPRSASVQRMLDPLGFAMPW